MWRTCMSNQELSHNNTKQLSTRTWVWFKVRIMWVVTVLWLMRTADEAHMSVNILMTQPHHSTSFRMLLYRLCVPLFEWVVICELWDRVSSLSWIISCKPTSCFSKCWRTFPGNTSLAVGLSIIKKSFNGLSRGELSSFHHIHGFLFISLSLVLFAHCDLYENVHMVSGTSSY